MSEWLVILLYGIVQGSLYTLVALGVTLTFGVTHILNFAHGEFVTIAAFALILLAPEWGIVPAIGTSIVIVAVIAAVVYTVGFRRTMGNHLQGLALSLGLLLFIENLMVREFSTNPRRGPRVDGFVDLWGGDRISVARLIVIGVTAALVAALYLGLKRSWMGIALRSCGDDELAAATIGLPARRVGLYAFVVSALVAAVAGFSIASVTPVTPSTGVDYLFKAFVVVIIGGLGSAPGALLAAMLLGILEAFGARYIDPGLTNVYGFVLMIVVLLIAPQGLMNRRVARAG